MKAFLSKLPRFVPEVVACAGAGLFCYGLAVLICPAAGLISGGVLLIVAALDMRS